MKLIRIRESIKPYHMIFGRNIDNNSMIDFYEMTSDNVQGNTLMQRKLLSVLKKRFEEEYITVLQEKHIYKRPRFLLDNIVFLATLP